MGRVRRRRRSLLQFGVDRKLMAYDQEVSCACGAWKDTRLRARQRYLNGQSAGTSDGESRRRKCVVGRGSEAEESTAMEIAARNEAGDRVRRIDRDSGFAGA